MRPGFRWSREGRQFLKLSAMLLLAGCTTTAPIHYYQLSAHEEIVPTSRASDGLEALEIGIGPVTLPAYLDRPQIATRTTANQLSFADSQRWAEPLTDNFSRVLATNLSRLLGTDRFQTYPWPRSRSIDWQIVVEILKFENQADGTAVLEARWTVRSGTGDLILPARRSRFERTAAGPDLASRVYSLSYTVADLCQEIATGLMALQERQP